MRKKYYYFSLLLLTSTMIFAQKVTLTPTNVNGIAYGSGPINLGGVAYSTVALTVKVEIPNGTAANDQGTIKIYASNSAAVPANITIGGDGGYLYFGGGKIATRSFNINLSWGSFQTSSGIVYAEYRSSTGIAYKSSNIPLIKNSTISGGGSVNPPADAPNPTQISNTLCCNQTIRQGEKPEPIKGSQYANPYKSEIYGINSRWTAGSSIEKLDFENQILQLDYVTELKNFTITRELGYNGNRDFPNKGNVISITVLKSPFSVNEISVDTPLDDNGFAQIITTNPKPISGNPVGINLNILQDPNHVEVRGDNYAYIDRYEWQYKKLDND